MIKTDKELEIAEHQLVQYRRYLWELKEELASESDSIYYIIESEIKTILNKINELEEMINEYKNNLHEI